MIKINPLGRGETFSFCAVSLLTFALLISPAAMNAAEGTRPATGTQRTQAVLPVPEPDSKLYELIRQGASMEEIAAHRDPVATNPDTAILALKTGNSRFFGGRARRPEMSANERRSQILSQTPFAVILGCSDSRVPTEIVFDQSLGSLFVVRVAGNISVPVTDGSVEYAIKHLKSHVIVVMGHEGCGAVAAATLKPEQLQGEPKNVRYLVEHIQPSVKNLPAIRDQKARMREAVISNVRLQVYRLGQNPVVAEAVQRGQVKVIGAYYEIGSGAVDFLDTEEELRVTQ